MVVAELDCACTSQAHVHWIYSKFPFGYHNGIIGHLGWVFVDHVVAAFGFKWDFEVEFAHKIFGPDASSDDGVHAGNAGLTSFHAGDAAF